MSPKREVARSIVEFLNAPGEIFDVRSPSEYAHAHIPKAINLPLFSDQERAAVGTTYKKSGKQHAVQLGLELVGPRLADLASMGRRYAVDGYARVHCWRGGMRSSSMAWLLETMGLKVLSLDGGYKAFRRWVLGTITSTYSLKVLGGLTGSGKTLALRALKEAGEQVLDLEDIAHHRGSSFGKLNMPQQPSVEQFENSIAVQLSRLDPNKPIWIEDESRLIGTCKIPNALYFQMQQAPLYFMVRPKAERLDILLNEYGAVAKEDLISATQRLIKKLGSVRTKAVIENISCGRFLEAAEMMLDYYDTAYCHGMKKRKNQIMYIEGEKMSDAVWAQLLCAATNSIR